MDTRFIKRDFKRLPATTPLPQPTTDGLVGIACPSCDAGQKTTPLKYINRLPNAWRVAAMWHKAPHGTSGHFYHTWSDDQLNFEIASINAGHWPAALFPRPPSANSNRPTSPALPHPVTPSQSLLNRLFNTTDSTSSSGTSADPSITCFGVKGKTGPTHQIADARRGNKNCVFKACASCCQNVGDQVCGAKGHRKPLGLGNHGASHPFLNRGIVTSTNNFNPFHQRPPPSASHIHHQDQHNCETASGSAPPEIPVHRRIPTQSAQAGGLVAHEFNSEQLAAFFDLQSAREQTLLQMKSFDADESKVVHVTAWLQAEQPPLFFSFIAPKWPSFSLQQCQPLVSEAALKASLSDGPVWSRRLQFWDPKSEGWQRTGSINIPSRLPIAPREIFVKANTFKPEECPRLDQLIYAAYYTPTYSQSDSSSTQPPDNLDPSVGNPSAVDGKITIVPSTRSQNILDTFGNHSNHGGKIIIIGKGVDLIPNPKPNDKLPNSSSANNRQHWPDLSSPIERTIYRHSKWIGIVTKRKAKDWESWLQEQTMPLVAVTLGAARTRFRQEFILAGCPPSTSSSSSTPASTSSAAPVAGCKRKLGE
ncbi:uncharacterized protein MELLADRAFT_92192 [Melampsora larici-populina 98AG31]|uniref:Uncharacterized protein n=1 Tax=Melampsora larici-populina (strain 98AG31 / pathotype 3-4-7) TaxID=747676 RepID=F4S1U8_MELLP|nr:uncharacterized protein MELLADRAFT_92192 [Melampsora larici-populina 98AG31]EGG01445.1 hypothetical protein MELLADRAFT_92192 [Melampsora larici-populina 98AG31]